MLQQKTTVIDLNWLLSYGDILLSSIRRTTANEQRTNIVFADPRFCSKASIPSVCQSLQGKSSPQILLMFRSISDNGFCPTDVSQKPQRYRNLLTSLASKALSLWLSWKRFSQQFSQCQRKTRLANLSRLCTGSHQKSPATLRRRRLWRDLGKYGLCLGRNRHRSVPVAVSMGTVSHTQKCREASYAHGPERRHSHVYTHYKRVCTRNDRVSRHAFRTGRHLRHGQGLHGFCNIIQFIKEPLLLYHSGQKGLSALPK